MTDIRPHFTYDPATKVMTLKAVFLGPTVGNWRTEIYHFQTSRRPEEIPDEEHGVSNSGLLPLNQDTLILKIPVETALGHGNFRIYEGENPAADLAYSVNILLYDQDIPNGIASNQTEYFWIDRGYQYIRLNGGDDIAYTGADNDRLWGGNGDDYLNGGADDDQLYGGIGDDRIVGGTGADILDGGEGIDVLDYTASSAGIDLHLRRGTASGGDAEGDSIANFERVLGSRHDDLISGDQGANALWGYGGNDRLYGGSGDDRLLGGGGNDRLEGQRGADRLEGGAGADVFVFRDPRDSTYYAPGRDTIMDFSSDEGDRIHLTHMDADVTIKGNQAFTFIGLAAFSGRAGELKVNTGHVLGDIDGDGIADFAIAVNGAKGLTADDFWL